MMRLISICLLIVLALPGVSRLWIMADFNLNRETIAELFCINKEKPMTICYGSCYLGQQLREVENNEAEESQTVTYQIKISPYLFTTKAIPSGIGYVADKLQTFRFVSRIYYYDPLNRIFHPPKCVA